MKYYGKTMLFAVVFILLQQSTAVIYRLNDTEYNQLPALYHLDDYNRCIPDDGLYCDVRFTLVSHRYSELLSNIKDYSAHTTTHFNHTSLHYGICVTKICKNFFKDNTETDLSATLEACLNESFWNDYKLRTRVFQKPTCMKADDEMTLDVGDAVVAFICLILITVNVVGSLYDFCFVKEPTNKGNTFLLCFSIRRNWSFLVGPSNIDPKSHAARLRGFDGLKTLTTALVIVGHATLPFVIIIENPHYVEEIYHNIFYQIMFNGTIIVQTFFMTAGFLLAYNFQESLEKQKISWKMFPKGVVNRWLRLTPSYAVLLAVTTTWIKYAGSGPVWPRAVVVEVEDCRRYWWTNLVYINNYIDNSQCMAQAWYLATDMQLYILGLLLCVLARNSKVWKIGVWFLLVVGLVVPMVQVFVQDLNGLLIVTPETGRNFFVKDPTFNQLYKRGHTNIFCYILGLALGYQVYYWQRSGFDLQKYKKYRFLYWLIFPAMIGVALLGSVFYIDGPRLPATIRATYAGLSKLCYGLLLYVLITGMIFKFEKLYRSILEWRGWIIPARLSYCAYLLHVFVIRTLIGSRMTLMQLSIYQAMEFFVATLVITFLASVPLWLLVESPFRVLVKLRNGKKQSGPVDDSTKKINTRF